MVQISTRDAFHNQLYYSPFANLRLLRTYPPSVFPKYRFSPFLSFLRLLRPILPFPPPFFLYILMQPNNLRISGYIANISSSKKRDNADTPKMFTIVAQVT